VVDCGCVSCHLRDGVAPSPPHKVNQQVETDVGYSLGSVSVIFGVAVIPTMSARLLLLVC
jgi:hypothetical protein